MPSRILIAEEEQECCQLFKQYLQRCGYEVATVHDAVSCAKALHDGATPDVLILSRELPWSEGEDILDWLRGQRFDETPMVVLTARMHPDAHEQEQALPGVTWLQRPFRLRELLASVQSAVRVPRNNWRCVEVIRKKRPDRRLYLDRPASLSEQDVPAVVWSGKSPAKTVPALASLPSDIASRSCD